MFYEELTNSEICQFQTRIAHAVDHPELTFHELEALDSLRVRLRRYGGSLFLSIGERQKLVRIFDKAGALSLDC
jgi:hypothetical protein